jgi:2-methylcitrate dehydratase PrpD
MANAFINAPGEITGRLTDYIVAARWSDLPTAVRREALRSFVNIMGCTIGGAQHEVVDLADRSLRGFAGAPQATLIGRGTKADAMHACLINCLASSIYSYDDTHAEAVVHPAGPVATAALALAERLPTSGADFLLALALGIEMTCRLSKAISVPPAKGTVAWSQTGITAGIGAAVAAARLLQLDARRLQYAIGIALSQAAGFRVMHATMVSSLMPAQGAQTGLRAALMAEHGFTASPAALEGRYGFLEVFAETPDLTALSDELGERFEVLRNTYKPYPCGIVIHPIIDACLQLRGEHEIDPGSIDNVSIKASPGAMALCDRRNPQNELQAHVSLYHWTAATLLRGTARIQELQDPTVRDPEVVAFQDRVKAEGDPGMAADAVEVTLTLKDGSRRTCRIDHCIGSASNPMTDEQLTRKFAQLAEPVVGKARAEELVERSWAVETTADVGDLACMAK